jgi:hypothetical protein
MLWRRALLLLMTAAVKAIALHSNFSVVGGGTDNTASGDASTVAGGLGNLAAGNEAAVGGGWNNSATGDDATIAGGLSNSASGEATLVGFTGVGLRSMRAERSQSGDSQDAGSYQI